MVLLPPPPTPPPPQPPLPQAKADAKADSKADVKVVQVDAATEAKVRKKPLCTVLQQ
jgi:hypothetical protein